MRESRVSKAHSWYIPVIEDVRNKEKQAQEPEKEQPGRNDKSYGELEVK